MANAFCSPPRSSLLCPALPAFPSNDFVHSDTCLFCVCWHPLLEKQRPSCSQHYLLLFVIFLWCPKLICHSCVLQPHLHVPYLLLCVHALHPISVILHFPF